MKSFKKVYPVKTVKKLLNKFNDNESLYLTINNELREIFKKSRESDEKDKMVDQYCEKFKHLKIDYSKIKGIKDELA